MDATRAQLGKTSGFCSGAAKGVDGSFALDESHLGCELPIVDIPDQLVPLGEIRAAFLK